MSEFFRKLMGGEILRFADPVYLWLLLLPLVLLFVQARRGPAAAVMFASTRVVRALGKARRGSPGFWRGLLLSLGLASAIVALARPQIGGGVSQVSSSGIEIMLSMDISGSMLALDFFRGSQRIDRLEASKTVTQRFINKRPADRIGMMAFAAQPFLVSPLTMDHTWLIQRLHHLEVGLVDDGTAIGSAISSAANRLKGSEAKSRIIVLLTDGSNNAGKIDPTTAAEAAAALGIKIYTIGVGTQGIVPIPVNDRFGRTVLRNVDSSFDEATLRRIAHIAEGRYFRAKGMEELNEIFDEIDQLEKSTFQLEQYVNYRDLYHWPLALGLGLICAHGLFSLTRWRTVP